MAENCVLNLSCPICKLVFKNADTIYSTSCGHIFHFACLNSWKAQSTSCPQCRDYNPTTHRVYLNFDEVNENTSQILSVQLNDSKKKIVDLEKDVADKRILFQKLRCESDKFRKIAAGHEKNLLEIVQKLEMENQTIKNKLKEANERIEKDMKATKQMLNENSELKSDLESKDIGASEAILKSKIKVLEQKLKLITTAFEKEISKSTELSIERMKLQSYMEHMKSTSITPTHQQKPKVYKKPKQKMITSPTKTIIIQKLPSEKIEFPLENVIISLALDMHFVLCKEDIKSVINKASTKTDMAQKELTLLVEFKTEALKQKFILGKDLLKNSPTLVSIEITEYDTPIRPLFVYANKKLRGKVFDYIAIKSNSVVARKTLDSEEVNIESCGHVDDLLKQS